MFNQDNRYDTLTSAVEYAATILDAYEGWKDNAGTLWDPDNLQSVLATASDDDEDARAGWYCVGHNGRIGWSSQDNEANVQWLYDVVVLSDELMALENVEI